MKKSIFATDPMAFGEPGAKQSQDDKPCKYARPVRTTSIDHGFRSHLSLRSRCGSGHTATWPQLTGIIPSQLIPARPFGLGLRFDEALLVTPLLLAARSIKPTPRGSGALAQSGAACNLGVVT